MLEKALTELLTGLTKFTVCLVLHGLAAVIIVESMSLVSHSVEDGPVG
jgi:hypothetical protein